MFIVVLESYRSGTKNIETWRKYFDGLLNVQADEARHKYTNLTAEPLVVEPTVLRAIQKLKIKNNKAPENYILSAECFKNGG